MEWVEKVSFARLNKLFEISTSERDHQVLLSDNNLQALVKESKSFILPILPCLAPQSLVLNKHYLLKDPPFYKVARVADSKAHQACLEQREKKHQEETLRHAPATNCSTSNSTVSLPTKKKKRKGLFVQPVQSVRTLPHQLHLPLRLHLFQPPTPSQKQRLN